MQTNPPTTQPLICLSSNDPQYTVLKHSNPVSTNVMFPSKSAAPLPSRVVKNDSQTSKEMEQIMDRLERGATLQHYITKSRKFERKFFFFRRDTQQLVWNPFPATSTRPDISVSVRGLLD